MQVELDNHNVFAISGVHKREEHVPGVKYIRMERSAHWCFHFNPILPRPNLQALRSVLSSFTKGTNQKNLY
jgi:hypothetical protein